MDAKIHEMTTWVTIKELANQSRVSVRTMEKMRDSSFKIGKHYRRKTPGSRNLLYDLEACEKTINRLCSV